jgi:hypothetical protein
VKRSHVLALATIVVLVLAAGLGQAASAAVSKRASSAAGITPAHGKIGNARPVPGAAARIRALGLDDGEGELGSDDGGAGLASGHAAHGTIGSAAPSVGAAARIAALGLDD